ncbi:M15 family metallopeptidase [Brevundimonas diminuta]|uniref:M15 family metallopeptidase n=1 Tax=Brevundimonas diminuta TaxID=293 RepID=UPI0025A58C1C|nr:M15 family metallopeptidase [Brevundimonas diminuta]MDM8352908.1 M15 family metallopeptidase [Brevundimonas diminuta]
MAFRLSSRSKARLEGVHPDLIRVVERAIEITAQDFSVHDGLRTLEEQKRYVASGASQTLNSKHRPQADGYGHAVDLVPFINGIMRWEWEPIYVIAAAVWQAAQELGVAVRWGGAWIDLADIKAGTPGAMKAAVEAYGAARRKAGKKAFTDGPHFELVP